MTSISTAHVAGGGTLVYVLLKDRAEFDRLKLEATDHGEDERGGHVLSKSLDANGVMVIFQFWIKSPPLKLEGRGA